METKNPDAATLKSLSWMNYPSHCLVPPHFPGGGGLALLWKQNLEVTILSTSQNFIDSKIKAEGKSFFATFLYGEPDRTKRKEIWNQLTALGTSREGAWYLTGDFNDIIDSSEKQGGPERHEGIFVDIRSFMAECDLFDLRHSGNFFSWRGKRHDHIVHCRVDRAMSNGVWAESYPASRCVYLRFEGSDHRLLLTHFDLTKKKKKGVFRYDRRLKTNEEISNLILEAWNLNDEEDVKAKLDRCRTEIISWTRNKHQNSQKVIEANRQRLEEAMSSQDSNQDLISDINIQLIRAYQDEEEYWKQRSRHLWLALGDKNTGYFHAITRGRTTINKFSVIENEEGVPVFEEEGILSVITEYFSNLFSSQVGDKANTIKEAIHPCITPDTNTVLTKMPTEDEIKALVSPFMLTKRQVLMAFQPVSFNQTGVL